MRATTPTTSCPQIVVTSVLLEENNTVEFFLNSLRKKQRLNYLFTKGHSKKFPFVLGIIYLSPSKEDNLSIRDLMIYFILLPKCPLFGSFAVEQ